MLRHAWVVLVLLMACPPPIDSACERHLVDEDGVVSIDTGPGGGGQKTPLSVVGQPVTLTVSAPLTSCEIDLLSSRVEITSSDNFPLLGATLTEPTRSVAGIVRSELTFTPTQPGLHVVHLAFEPSLGVRTRLVEVIESKVDPEAVRVPVSDVNGCLGSVWPLTEDTVACERATQNIELISSDGGVRRFPGEQLVVVDRVLWSVERANGENGELHRHVFEDGGLRLAHTFPNFSTRLVQGMHDEGLAIRARDFGRLVAVRVGDSVLDTMIDASTVAGQLHYIEDEALVSPNLCTDSSCSNGLLGLEPGVVWIAQSWRAGVAAGFPRPLGPDGEPEFLLPRATEPLALPQWGFERLPVWIPLSEGLAVLVNGDRPALGLSAWKRAEVVRVGRRFVVLEDGPGSVRVTPR